MNVIEVSFSTYRNFYLLSYLLFFEFRFIDDTPHDEHIFMTIFRTVSPSIA